MPALALAPARRPADRATAAVRRRSGRNRSGSGAHNSPTRWRRSRWLQPAGRGGRSGVRGACGQCPASSARRHPGPVPRPVGCVVRAPKAGAAFTLRRANSYRLSIDVHVRRIVQLTACPPTSSRCLPLTTRPGVGMSFPGTSAARPCGWPQRTAFARQSRWLKGPAG